MEALREGMRNLGEALAQQRQPGQQPGQGNPSETAQGQQLDPLGRNNGKLDDGGKLGEGSGAYGGHGICWKTSAAGQVSASATSASAAICRGYWTGSETGGQKGFRQAVFQLE